MLDFFSEAKIYSFEPVPDAFQDLMQVAANRVQIVPVESAVSLQSGDVTFYVTQSDVGSSLLEPIPGQPSKWLTLEKKVTVKSTRLDKFLDKENLNQPETVISLLKTDAQGADLDVIKSAGKFLNPNKIKAILVEINFRVFYHSQQNYFDIFSELDGKGYRLAWMYPHRAHDEWLWWADALFISK